MSERSELQDYGAFFAVQRRSAHWCAMVEQMRSPSHESMVHQ
jgi:hypothetical protein